MPIVEFSQRAKIDLDQIAAYTVETWGADQALLYMGGLREICSLLSTRPPMGRPLGQKWRRWQYQSHIIVYRPMPGGIRVQRIIHYRRLLENLVR